MRLRDLADKIEKIMMAVTFAEVGEWDSAVNLMGQRLKGPRKRPAKQALRKDQVARPRLTL